MDVAFFSVLTRIFRDLNLGGRLFDKLTNYNIVDNVGLFSKHRPFWG